MTDTTTTTTPVKLSSKTQRMVDDLRRPFTAFAKDYSQLFETKEDLAPKFMRAYASWAKESEGGTFVAFVRLLDSSVSEAREEYRTQRAYQAADYLRRLAQGGATKRRAHAKEATSMREGLARVMASLLRIVPNEQQPRVWALVESEFHWSPRQISSLQTAVTSAPPLVLVKAPYGKGGMPELRVTSPPAHAKAA